MKREREREREREKKKKKMIFGVDKSGISYYITDMFVLQTILRINIKSNSEVQKWNS
jgi:hypothetical protein